MKQFHAKLIDWNLVTFYYPGHEEVGRKGTVCYYPPEQLFRSNFPTPAIDIFALASVMFTYITGKNPYPTKCKDHNLKAICGLVGGERIFEAVKKYNWQIPDFDDYILKIMKDPKICSGISLMDRVPPKDENLFDKDLINLFEGMLEPDPEHRLTISEVINHPYFERVKKLPPMYSEKDDAKKDENEKSKKMPADNLLPALAPSGLTEFMEEKNI